MTGSSFSTVRGTARSVFLAGEADALSWYVGHALANEPFAVTFADEFSFVQVFTGCPLSTFKKTARPVVVARRLQECT